MVLAQMPLAQGPRLGVLPQDMIAGPGVVAMLEADVEGRIVFEDGVLGPVAQKHAVFFFALVGVAALGARVENRAVNERGVVLADERRVGIPRVAELPLEEMRHAGALQIAAHLGPDPVGRVVVVVVPLGDQLAAGLVQAGIAQLAERGGAGAVDEADRPAALDKRAVDVVLGDKQQFPLDRRVVLLRERRNGHREHVLNMPRGLARNADARDKREEIGHDRT